MPLKAFPLHLSKFRPCQESSDPGNLHSPTLMWFAFNFLLVLSTGTISVFLDRLPGSALKLACWQLVEDLPNIDKALGPVSSTAQIRCGGQACSPTTCDIEAGEWEAQVIHLKTLKKKKKTNNDEIVSRHCCARHLGYTLRKKVNRFRKICSC